MLVPLAAPAGAATLVDGCTFTTNPASGGSQSALRAACNFPTASSVPAKNVISDFSNAQWHNGAASDIFGAAIDMGAEKGNLAAIVAPNAHPDGTFNAQAGVYLGNTNLVNHQISGTINGKAISAYA
ncbi:MAG: hypothetical protein EBX39_02985, partial [Actinobacteria bacterium]|nr:hypothetical protein [Actinomycetota bacterium]